MYRGTTPTLTFNIDADVSEIKSLTMTFSQGGKIVYTKQLFDCDVIEENNSIVVKLTQEETLQLEPNKDLHIQLKVEIDENVYVSKYLSTYVNDILDEEII